MIALTPALRTYDWGTRGDIPALLGQPPGHEPVAEAWWGAHPLAPARAINGDEVSLDAYIADDREYTLGAQVASRWETLPYLLKVLSVHKPLSIQVHPSLEQARAGFAREDAAGVSRTAPDRLFKDPFHKPELVIALTPMVVLSGFRPFADTAADLKAIGGPATALIATVDGAPSYDDYVHACLSMSDCHRVIEAMQAAAYHPGASASMVAAARAAVVHPGDAGALLALAMNAVALEPGSAMFTGAGEVHSYQSGMGLEIMANSDNVVRAGLTSKSVDADLLLDLATTEPTSPHLITPRDAGAARVYAPDVEEFDCVMVSGGDAQLAASPRIVLALEGSAAVTSGAGRLDLKQGQAAFLPHGIGDVTVSAQVLAVAANVPMDPSSSSVDALR